MLDFENKINNIVNPREILCLYQIENITIPEIQTEIWKQ